MPRLGPLVFVPANKRRFGLETCYYDLEEEHQITAIIKKAWLETFEITAFKQLLVTSCTKGGYRATPQSAYALNEWPVLVEWSISRMSTIDYFDSMLNLNNTIGAV